MCGLVGFWNPAGQPAAQLKDLVLRMAQAIAYRGPDDAGAWADEQTGLVLGHRRLAILDLSPAGHQPMASADGRWIMAFNGEIYNHQELRAELEATDQAPAWRGHSDTETLLTAFAAWGVQQTLKKSAGMFALALWDRAERTLVLARDRLGEKPLYYGWQGNSFLFASELKALKQHPEFQQRIDRAALSLLLRHNYVPAPYSIYQGIYKLPPGTWLELKPGQRATEPKPYWSLTEVAQRGMNDPFSGSDNEALDRLQQLLGNAVQGQMMADVPLGTLLSGGLDSTLVTALMQSRSSQPVRSFTIGFEEQAYDETAHARAVARHLGTEHTELRLSGQDALDLVPSMARIYDEPFADSSQLPTCLVMQLARRHVTVALSGDGGDEFFGGYNRYIHAPKVWRRFGGLPQPLRQLAAASLTALPSSTINRLAAPLSRWTGITQAGDKAHKLGRRLHGLHSLDDLYLSLVSEWTDTEPLVIGGTSAQYLLSDRPNWPELENPVARMMALDALTYLPDDILVKVDRAAMAVSMETRAPFLDRQVVEFAWSLPMNMKIRNGQGKWLLRQLLDRYVPRQLMERPKMGFGIPLDAWLRGPLREWAEDLLSADRLQRDGLLNPSPIRSAWHAHVTGQASCGYRLWSVLMFQAWLEVNS